MILEKIIQNMEKCEVKVSPPKIHIHDLVKRMNDIQDWIKMAKSCINILKEGNLNDKDMEFLYQALSVAAPHLEHFSNDRLADEIVTIGQNYIDLGLVVSGLMVLRRFQRASVYIPKNDKVYNGYLYRTANIVRSTAKNGYVTGSVVATIEILKCMGMSTDPESVYRAMLGLHWIDEGKIRRPSWLDLSRIEYEVTIINQNNLNISWLMNELSRRAKKRKKVVKRKGEKVEKVVK